MRTKSAGKAARPRLWGDPEYFLEDLQKHRSIKKVCEMYANEDTSWRSLYADTWRWRKADPELDAKVKAILEEEGSSRENAGRPRNDGGDKSWQRDYVDALREFNLNLVKAAECSPYSVRQIEDFLDSNTSSFDPDFAAMVKEAYLHFASIATEQMVAALDDEAWSSFEQAKITQGRLWAAHKALEKLDSRRYGRKVEVSGTIDHRHQHRLMPHNEKLGLLWQDRKEFIERRRQAVLESSAVAEEPEAVDVEVISES